jgi:hypothetical protein
MQIEGEFTKMSKSKRKSYLMHFNEIETERFDLIQKTLGWTTIDTVRKLLQLFVPAIKELKSGRELAILIRDESSKQIIMEKVSSCDYLLSPQIKAKV